MIPLFPVYLFDLDGTLVDSAADICGAIQEVLAANECPTVVDFDFLKGYIGRHLADLFGDIFPDYSLQQIDELIRQYRAIYLARGHKLTRVYPGVREALAALPAANPPPPPRALPPPAPSSSNSACSGISTTCKAPTVSRTSPRPM